MAPFHLHITMPPTNTDNPLEEVHVYIRLDRPTISLAALPAVEEPEDVARLPALRASTPVHELAAVGADMAGRVRSYSPCFRHSPAKPIPNPYAHPTPSIKDSVGEEEQDMFEEDGTDVGGGQEDNRMEQWVSSARLANRSTGYGHHDAERDPRLHVPPPPRPVPPIPPVHRVSLDQPFVLTNPRTGAKRESRLPHINHETNAYAKKYRKNGHKEEED